MENFDQYKHIMLNIITLKSLIHCLKKTLNEKQKEIFNDSVVLELEELLEHFKGTNISDEDLSLIKNNLRTIKN